MTDTEVTPLTPPTNVIEALSRVMGEIGGIERLNPAQRAQRGMGAGDPGITYAYRGIDQITQAAVPLLSKYGVVIVPVVERHDVRDGLGRNGNMMEHLMSVTWKVYGPGGLADVIMATTVGESRDSGDKGANKAQTAAFKNLLLRILCITDPADDTDNYHTAEDGPPASSRRTTTGAPSASESEVAAALASLKPPQKVAVIRYAGQSLGVRDIANPGEMAGEIMAAVRNVLAGREPHEGAPVAPAEPDDPETAADQSAESPADAVADPPTATASESPKARDRAKAKDEPPEHTCDWTPGRSTCTICGAEEPF